MIKELHYYSYFSRFTLVVFVLLLCGCQRSEPSTAQIQNFIENYQVTHDYNVASMDYQVEPDSQGQAGTISVSGKLALREPLYVEDLGSRLFRERVEKVLRRNRFSEREINHEIYDRVIRATTRIEGSENEYYTLLKEEFAPGYTINFSADLQYNKSGEDYSLDGTVNHPKLQGSRLDKFTNPVVNDSDLVNKAIAAVLAEQTRYRDLMKASSAVLNKLWDNKHGFLIWNRKTPYLGNENLSVNEVAQLREYLEWRGVYRVSNIKPVSFNTPHASNFFELGTYTTEGIATCLRQTGFARELKHLKSDFGRYCEFGKQYPIVVRVASLLNETNEFEASVAFEFGDASTGELIYDASYFQREENELARYSDQQLILFLNEPFDIQSHNRPRFKLIKASDEQPDLLRLEYTGETDYVAAGFDSTLMETLIANDVNDLSDFIAPLSSVESEAADDEQQSLKDEAAVSNAPTRTAEEIELVKSIQTELKRLQVYEAGIDGIAGEQTYWAMDYVQKQLGGSEAVRPSPAFLSLLQETPATAVTPPGQPVEAEPVAEEPAEKKETFGSWFTGLFKKKKDKPED